MIRDAHPLEASPKAERQQALLDLVRGRSLATQAEAVAALRERGIVCTQASVSRDVRELGLVKRDGCYATPEAVAAAAAVDEYAASIGGFLREMSVVGNHLVVVHTLPGTAHGVGVFIDGMAWPGVAGTVAGDDTIFAAVTDRAAGVRLMEALTRIREESP